MSVFRRVVFDTSTLVSAALRVGSTSHLALAHALATAEVCASASALGELEQVLLRAKFDRYQPTETRKEFAVIMRRRSSLFVVGEAEVSNVSPPCRDPKGNQFLALVEVCDADVLISSDADLLVHDPWNGVPILTASAFLERSQVKP